MDLIDRNELIKKLTDRHSKHYVNWKAFKNYMGERKVIHHTEMDECKEIIDIIVEQPIVEVPQWIPCIERLPYTDKNRKYLVCGEKGGIYIAEFVSNKIDGTPLGMSWWSAHGRYCPNPIAWMPLPEPYKGE